MRNTCNWNSLKSLVSFLSQPGDSLLCIAHQIPTLSLSLHLLSHSIFGNIHSLKVRFLSLSRWWCRWLIFQIYGVQQPLFYRALIIHAKILPKKIREPFLLKVVVGAHQIAVSLLVLNVSSPLGRFILVVVQGTMEGSKSKSIVFAHLLSVIKGCGPLIIGRYPLFCIKVELELLFLIFHVLLETFLA